MEEWKEYRFTDVASLTNGRAYLQPELQSAGKYRIVRVGNLSGGDKWFYSDMELPKEKYCNKGDLLYAWACSFGPYIWEGDKTIYHYHIWKVDVNTTIADKMFLYYYLKYYTPKWMGLTNGSVMMHITKGSLEKQIIHIPFLEIQRSIASILSSLDDKIAVNRRICENLEAQAQALFKHWFIDFAPFLDKPSGKAERKNDKFVESELGMIPEGWRVGTLEELVDIKYGKDHKKLNEGNIPAYGSAGLMRTVDEKLYDGESVLIPRKGTLNNIMYVNEAFWTVDTMFYTIPKKSNILKYLYMKLKRIDFNKMNVGTSIPSNSTSQLNKLKIVVPTDEILSRFDGIMSSLLQEIMHSQKESKGLATLRDTLLPKLMSGQIKV